MTQDLLALTARQQAGQRGREMIERKAYVHLACLVFAGALVATACSAWVPSFSLLMPASNDSNIRWLHRSHHRRKSPRSTLLQADTDDDDENNVKDLMNLLRPSPTCKVDQMSGTDLAYIGDVVFELFVRTRTVWPSKRTSDLQQKAVALVRGNLACYAMLVPFSP
jgi:hypothetical protein